jgi:DNA-binding MarR family transcriptional regulator
MSIAKPQLNELFIALRQLTRALKVAEDHGPAARAAEKVNPSDLAALLFIGDHEACIIKEVGHHLGLTATTTSSLVERLVRKGLVTRSRTEQNRRIARLALTAAGETLRQHAIADQLRHCRAMLAALDPGERPVLVSLMRKIASTADEIQCKSRRAPLELAQRTKSA